MIFITGATGFLGAYITHYLVASGAQVRALKRKSSPLDLCATFSDKVEWIEGELTDSSLLEEAMQGVEQVYHIAGLVSFDPKDEAALMHINHKGTERLINATLASKVRKVLYASSVSAIGRDKASALVHEDVEWSSSSAWNTVYGNSKRLGEMEVWRGAAEGLETVAINPSIILGSGYWRASLGFTKTVDRGMSFYPSGMTGFVDVRDVAKIAISLMNSDISQERYIISAEDIYYKDFFTKIAEHINVSAPKKLAGKNMTELVWRLEWLRSRLTGKRPIITKSTARVSQQSWSFSHKKIKDALNYTFRDMDESIKEMCEDYVKSKQEGKSFAFKP